MTNKELIERYPFLAYENIDYSEQADCTILDEMPIGWKIAFGEEMCEKIRQALIEENKKEEYTEEKLKEMADLYGIEFKNDKIDLLHIWKIEQLKEKFGEMRLYPNFFNEEIRNIINDYSIKSWHTCCMCGKPAMWESTDWICPYCDDCKPKGSVPIKDSIFGG